MKRLVLFLLTFCFMVVLTGCSNKYQYSQQLIEAIEEDNWEQFTYLLEKGGDLDSRPHFLGLDRVSMPPLHYSCYQGKLVYVVALVEAGADINKVELRSAYETPLIAALSSCEKTRLEVAKYLVEEGADVNLKVHGNTALEEVFSYNLINYNPNAELQDFEFALYLLEKGANIENVRYGNLIFSAARNNNMMMVEYLLTEMSVDINIVDDTGNSVLMHAVMFNSYRIVEYLLEKGASLDIVNNEGKTAFDLAVEKDYLEGELLTNNLKIQELLDSKRNKTD